MGLLMRRCPLLRAAAVGGGAYYMGQRHAVVQEREGSQEQRIGELEDQQHQPSPSAGSSSESVQKLQELGKLREQGVLTDDEFAQQKQKLLA